MLSISKKEVPSFLHATDFYQALDESDDQRFEVPKDCYKMDTTLKTRVDVVKFIGTIRFWGIEGTPKELVAYALKWGYLWCRPLFNDAEDDLKYLKILSEVQKSFPEDRISVAMKSGNLTVLQYLFENGHIWRGDSMKCAAKEGHLECIKYAHDNGCSWTPFTMQYIATGGHLECMKYAHENGCRWTIRTFDCIAGIGSIDYLQYAVAHGCPHHRGIYLPAKFPFSIETTLFFDSVYMHGACANAAHKGKLEMLKYLRGNNLAFWDHRTCAAAAAAGKLDCLKYAHENGCAWNANTTALAARYSHFHCLDYALLNGCPYDARTVFFMFIADHPDTHRLLRARCQDLVSTLQCAFEFACIVGSWVVMWMCYVAVPLLVGCFFYAYVRWLDAVIPY